MRGFLLGVIVTLLVVFGGAYWYMYSGQMDTRAVPNGPVNLSGALPTIPWTSGWTRMLPSRRTRSSRPRRTSWTAP